jgi:hypothetical protein
MKTDKLPIIGSILVGMGSCHAQKTDASLFLKSDGVQVAELASESGDLYKTAGHHGPAVENPWFALRMYFDKSCGIDVYSKQRPQLELRKALWYPTEADQKNGWGADYYKVGKTVGIGGIRLWDGKQAVPLHPVSQRIARVGKDDTSAWLEMLSEGVPYQKQKVDIRVRVTVYADHRMARVDASVVTGPEVQFVTGLNYHKGQDVRQGDNSIATWGLHPEDVAAELVPVGAAILFDPDTIAARSDDGSQHLLISKSSRQLVTWITSSSARDPEIGSLEQFVAYLDKVAVPQGGR